MYLNEVFISYKSILLSMQKLDNIIYYSASDFTKFIECRYASFTDYLSLTEDLKKTETSYTLKLFQEKGYLHEKNYLNQLKQDYSNIVEINEKTLEEKIKKTNEALKSGADIIFQAAFTSDNLIGYADFLIKKNTPSALGDYSYEVIDTKNSTKERAKFLLQLCFYNELLSKAQGVDPIHTHLVMGDNSKHTYIVSEYIHYYRKNKKRFLDFVNSKKSNLYPEKCNYCELCDWQERCENIWKEDNYINQIAGINKNQINKIKKTDIKTIKELSNINLTKNEIDIYPLTLDRLKSQAALQQHKLDTGEDKFEILELSKDKGFNRMPLSSDNDLYFDIEGDPFFEGGRLEYLFGIYFIEDKKTIFKAFWGTNHKEEEKNFRSLMSFIWKHIQKYPESNIYHYSNYEVEALKRLSNQYAIAEHELDNLLRREKFCDLFTIVRESIRISEPAYSIKNLETFYMKKRLQNIKNGGESIEIFHLWLQTKNKKYLDELEEYNKIDCISTHDLHEWLLKLRPDNSQWFTSNYLEKENNEKIDSKKEWEIEFDEYKKKLSDLSLKNEDRLPITIINLLEYHSRDKKSEWWRQFDRQNKFHDELIDDNECLAMMEMVDEPISDKRSYIYTYQYPEQDHKFREKSEGIDIVDLKFGGTILDIDREKRIIELRLGKGKLLEHVLTLGPKMSPSTGPLRKALYKYANNHLHKNKKYLAINDLLRNIPPRLKIKKDKLISNYKNLEEEAIEVVENLDNSTIFIQGPPGTGKTYIASKIIISLIKKGKTVGITSNSHKAIHVLLDQIEEQANKIKFSFNGVKKFSKDDDKYDGSIIENIKNTESIDTSENKLIAGTSWLFSHDHMDQKLDYLFIDEAGQVALANAVAAGTAAKNIVLIGDPNQLSNVNIGHHPGKSGLSSVEYVLGDDKTVPANKGIFLEKTRRLNKQICEFVSEAFYDGRLSSFIENDNRKILFKSPIQGINSQGIHVIYSDHIGCSQKSIEEGEVIKKLFTSFLKQSQITIDGKNKPITIDDILVVTPFNVQVNFLQSILPVGARIGTIDKFQGQEASIVLISMVSSSAEDMPRNIDFLFSKNRLNVALSRAQCLAVMVLNPNLFEVPCGQIKDMKSVNNFCWLEKFN